MTRGDMTGWLHRHEDEQQERLQQRHGNLRPHRVRVGQARNPAYETCFTPPAPKRTKTARTPPTSWPVTSNGTPRSWTAPPHDEPHEPTHPNAYTQLRAVPAARS